MEPKTVSLTLKEDALTTWRGRFSRGLGEILVKTQQKGGLMMAKAKCYECKYRGGIPGDAHSCCKHPDLNGATNDPLAGVMAMFASVGRAGPQIDIRALHEKFQIKANETGIRRGWFNWPWNFDPVWLENCNAFSSKEKVNRAISDAVSRETHADNAQG